MASDCVLAQGDVTRVCGAVAWPVVDQFDVYEVYDTDELKKPRTVLATARGSKRLDGVRGRFGGVLKTLTFEDKTRKEHRMYLEAMYYTPLP